MAEKDPTWRERIRDSRDSEKQRIDDTLATTPARVVIIGIVVVIGGWALISGVIGLFT